MKGRQDTKYELQYCYYRRKNNLMHFIYIQCSNTNIYEGLPMNISIYWYY